jgi:hypothetical protein
MLLFKKRFHQGLVDGSVTLTIRWWDKPHVKAGGRYRVHPIGVVEVDAVARITLGALSEDDARRAGFVDLAELVEYAKPVAKGPLTAQTPIFKVDLRYGGDGDRVQLALETNLDRAEIDSLCKKLGRLDAKGPWVRQTLKLISRRPKVAASKLAASIGRPTEPFKIDVRKLKKLGLTESYEVGYGLSPRGLAFLAKKPRW